MTSLSQAEHSPITAMMRTILSLLRQLLPLYVDVETSGDELIITYREEIPLVALYPYPSRHGPVVAVDRLRRGPNVSSASGTTFATAERATRAVLHHVYDYLGTPPDEQVFPPMKVYPTRGEATHHEILRTLGLASAYAKLFDVEAISQETIIELGDGAGFQFAVGEAEFGAKVAYHHKNDDEGRIMYPIYETRDDAIEHEIIRAIEASSEVHDAYAEYDIDGIADEVVTAESSQYGQTHYVVAVDHDSFWEVVAANELARCATCGSRDHVDCTPVPVGATVLTPDTLAHLADMATNPQPNDGADDDLASFVKDRFIFGTVNLQPREGN